MLKLCISSTLYQLPHHQQQGQVYQQEHHQYGELPVNDFSDKLNVSTMPPANRTDVMAGTNQQGQLYDQQQQHHYKQAQPLGEQIRYNPHIQPQHPKIGYDQPSRLGSGMAPGFWDMGPTPRKQKQQFGMDYQQQQPQEQIYIFPLDREVVQPPVRQQTNQSELCL